MSYNDNGKVGNNIPATTPVPETRSEINTSNKRIYSAEPSTKSSTGNVSPSIFDKSKSEKIKKDD